MTQPSVVVTGLGLMGGSAAAALSAAGWRVELHHRRDTVARAAAGRGWGTAHATLADAARAAEIAIIGAPVPHVAAITRELLAANPDLLVTDMGSTKAAVCDQLAAESAAGRFVGSHPMCGSHLQGLDHADATIFRGATVALTPLPTTPPSAVERIEALWTAIGGRCQRFAPDDHDRAVASASHLPHVLAAASATLLDDGGLRLAATGFRDVSRVAAGSPALWRDILGENRNAVRDLLGRSRALLGELEAALEAGDLAAIEAWLERGRAGRQRYEDRQRSE